MNTRLSVSTIAYLAEQGKLGAEEKLRQERAKIEDETQRQRWIDEAAAKGALPYNPKLAIEIAERVSSGELLIDICIDERMPTVRRVNQWLKANPDFNSLYRESINDRLDIFSEEIIKIADDASRDFKDVMRGGRMVRVPDGEQVARSKLKVEMRLKHLRAFRPQIWAENSFLNVRQSDADIDNLSPDELEKKIADLQYKHELYSDDPKPVRSVA